MTTPTSRLRLADAWVVTAEGDEVPAELPGGDQNWLKIIVPFTVEDGQVTEIVIAFDLSRSIVETPPGSGNFKIKPVLHAHVGQGARHEGEGGGEGGGGSGGEGGSGEGGGDGGQGSGGEGGSAVKAARRRPGFGRRRFRRRHRWGGAASRPSARRSAAA